MRFVINPLARHTTHDIDGPCNYFGFCFDNLSQTLRRCMQSVVAPTDMASLPPTLCLPPFLSHCRSLPCPCCRCLLHNMKSCGHLFVSSAEDTGYDRKERVWGRVRGKQRWGKRTRTRPRSRIVYVVYCWLHYLVASLLRCWAAALVSARLPLSVCLPVFSYLSWADVSWLPALPSPPRSHPFALALPHTCRAM